MGDFKDKERNKKILDDFVIKTSDYKVPSNSYVEYEPFALSCNIVESDLSDINSDISSV